MDGGAWKAAVHGVAKSRAWLSDFTLSFHFHALEKEMATHSSVLAWRIPGTGEPGGLPSVGSHRVGHDWSDLAAAAACSVFIISIFSITKTRVCSVERNDVQVLIRHLVRFPDSGLAHLEGNYLLSFLVSGIRDQGYGSLRTNIWPRHSHATLLLIFFTNDFK